MPEFFSTETARFREVGFLYWDLNSWKAYCVYRHQYAVILVLDANSCKSGAVSLVLFRCCYKLFNHEEIVVDLRLLIKEINWLYIRG